MPTCSLQTGGLGQCLNTFGDVSLLINLSIARRFKQPRVHTGCTPWVESGDQEIWAPGTALSQISVASEPLLVPTSLFAIHKGEGRFLTLSNIPAQSLPQVLL